jgi:hypothetical protein
MYHTILPYPNSHSIVKKKTTMLPNYHLRKNAAANNLCSSQQQAINNAFTTAFAVAEAAAAPQNPPAPVPCLGGFLTPLVLVAAAPPSKMKLGQHLQLHLQPNNMPFLHFHVLVAIPNMRPVASLLCDSNTSQHCSLSCTGKMGGFMPQTKNFQEGNF